MAQLVDPSLLNALSNIYAQRNQALSGLSQSLLGGAAQIGSAAIGRKKDAKAAQADLDRAQGDVQMQQQQLIDELARIRQARSEPSGQYEAAMLEQAEAETTGKLRDLGAYQKELGAIGDIGFRNVYDVRKPSKLEPIGSAGAKGRIMDIGAAGEQAIAQQKADRDAREAARREAKDIRDYEQRERLGKEKAADRVSASVAIKQAEKEIERAEQQKKAEMAHNRIEGTLSEMSRLIDTYGDTLFAKDTAWGRIRDAMGTAAGTEAQAARDQFDNLETELTELAVEARKGTGTISDADLAVIQRSGIGRSVSSSAAARKIIDRILKKSAQKAGANPQGTPSRGPVQLDPDEEVVR